MGEISDGVIGKFIKDIQFNQSEVNKKQLRDILPFYTTRSDFEDLTWYFDNVQKPGTKLSRYTAYFSKCPELNQEVLKYFTLTMLSDNSYDADTVCKATRDVNKFFRYIEVQYPSLLLGQVNRAIISEYVSYIEKKYSLEYRIKLYYNLGYFFTVMRDFYGMPEMNPMLPQNPFPRLRSNIGRNNKMIPAYVSAQMDVAFKNPEIPLAVRVAYWVMRSFPSRVSEITGMPIDCILPAMRPSFYTLRIPTWKQNGGYLQSESRLMEIKDEGHGAFLLDLIKQQQTFALDNQVDAFDKDKNLLLLYKVQYMTGPDSFYRNKVVKLMERKRPVLLNQALVLKSFNKVCNDFNITDEGGKPYLFKSHQLRHTGITDRIYEGFRLEDVRDMTNHKNYAMLVKSYIHINRDALRKRQEEMFKQKGLNSMEKVLFKGIIFTSKGQEERLLDNPKASRIGNIGVCSDATNCTNGPTECLMCSYFIPDAEQLDYFEMQVNEWQQKSKLFKKNPIWYEHAINNIAAYQCAVDKIKKVLTH